MRRMRRTRRGFSILLKNFLIWAKYGNLVAHVAHVATPGDAMIAEVQIRSAKMPSDVCESAVLIAQGVDL
jgi:hypothetical protein